MTQATSKVFSDTTNSDQSSFESLKSNVSHKFEDAKALASEKFESTKTAISGGFDTSKTAVADKLHLAADTINDKVADSPVDSPIAKYGQKAADILDRSADYVDDFDPSRLKADIQNHVKENPGRTLLIAAAVGLLLGAIFQRSRKN